MFSFLTSKREVVMNLFGKTIYTGSFVIVSVYFRGDVKPHCFIVFNKDLKKFIDATLELHYKPGINPHVKHDGKEKVEKPVEAIKLTTQEIYPKCPYWWSTPGLQKNDDPNGATIWDWSTETTVWERPEGE